MIADWTVEVSAEGPWIDAPWADWVDLRWDPADPLLPWREEQAAALPEVQQFPELLAMLAVANMNMSSTKVDVFPVTRDDVDPEISEAGEAATACGLGSYLDMLTARKDAFPAFAAFEQVARRTATLLHAVALEGCCVEIVVRPARLYDEQTYGWTLYTMGFGPDEAAARTRWAEAARVSVHAVQRCVAEAVMRFDRQEA